MANTRKVGDEATLEYYPRPGFSGGPGHSGMPPGYPGHVGVALATAYVPPQVFSSMYSLSDALDSGTLFPELYRPYPLTN